MADANGKYIFYHYDPSLAAAIVFILVFALSTILHVFQLLRKRTWYFIPFVVGGIFETIGYVGRALSAQQSPNWGLPPYIIQSLLILLAPLFFAASIYMVLARIIRLTNGEALSLIRVNWVTGIFVTGDVISFLAQSAGGGILAKAKDNDAMQLGEHVIMGGLILQVIFFGFFIIVAGVFHLRISRCPTDRSQTIQLPWKRHLVILYSTSFLILIRSIFRLIEYAMGQDGVLLSTEVYLYIFDATLMITCMTLMNIWHPSAIISMDGLRNAPDEPVAERVGYDIDDQKSDHLQKSLR